MSTTDRVRKGDRFIYDGNQYTAQSDPVQYPHASFGPSVTITVDNQTIAFQIKEVMIFRPVANLKEGDAFKRRGDDVVVVLQADPVLETVWGDRELYTLKTHKGDLHVDQCYGPIPLVSGPVPTTVQTTKDGSARTFTQVGGYPIFYLSHDEEAMCPKCALAEIVEFCQVDTFDGPYANWEDRHLYCNQCSNRIESAYNEPLHADTDRIDSLTDDVIGGLWDLVAQEYHGEISSGDFPPCEEKKLNTAVKEAITNWIKFNGRDEQ